MLPVLAWLFFVFSVIGLYRLVIYFRKTPQERWQERYDSKLKKYVDYIR
jgi:hypothetical protein